MYPIVKCTFKGVLRDRVLQGVLTTTLFFLFIPLIATFSMRQVVELSINLSLGLFSFILLLLTVFLGATSLWKDFERRYTYSVLGLPLSRSSYLLGKYFGMAIFIVIVAVLIGALILGVVWVTDALYPSSRPVSWGTLILAEMFVVLKYLLLLGFAFLFSAVSTSFFLPVFGTIAIFMAGSVTQEVYDYLQTETGRQTVEPFLMNLAEVLYYCMPNFGAFDLQLNAIYALPLSVSGLFLTIVYGLVYLALLLAIAALIFQRRELT